MSIQLAVGQKLEKFLFEGTEISLVKTCAVFVTMNPGY
jgi:dynein heavy chain